VNNRALKFHDLNIIRAPGFTPPGFTIDNLHPQINIIYGANAAGKTTAARAFSYLIWPEYAPEKIYIQGKFDLEGIDWFAELDTGKTIYQKNGNQSPRPSFPSVEHRDRYYLALHDLLQQETTGEPLAKIISRELAGGYQVSKAIKELGFKDKAFRKGKKSRQANKKIKEYQQALRKQKELVTEEKQLQQLYKELQDVKEAQKNMELVKQALKYSQANKNYKEIKTEFERFPEQMSRIEGNEEQKLREIKRDIEKYYNKKKTAKSKFKKAAKVVKDINLTDKGVQESVLTEIKNKKEKLKSKEETKKN